MKNQSATTASGRRVRYLCQFGVVLSVAAFAGCKSSPKVNPQAAFLEGQQRAWTGAQMNQEPAVFFRGMVRNLRVTWREDLTLAQALLEAEYTGALEPMKIRLTRQGQSHTIDVRRLLRGKENPVLEPGDLIEVLR